MEKVYTTNSNFHLLNQKIDDKTSCHLIRIVNVNSELSLNDQVILVDTSVSDVILNLPVENIYDGKFYYIKDINKADFIVLNGNGLNVNGMPDYTLKTGGSCKVIFSKAKNGWFVFFV